VSLLVGYKPTGAVGYISYYMGTFDLPEIYTLALGPGPSCSCVYFRQITRAHVITITNAAKLLWKKFKTGDILTGKASSICMIPKNIIYATTYK